MTIGELRQASGLTQQDLAFEIGVTIRTIANWENRQLGELKTLQRNAVLRFAKKHKLTLD
jgi:transcriptional regulator with XRE-family HTH domain